MSGVCEEVWPLECVCGHDVVDHDYAFDQPDGVAWLCAGCDCDGYQPAAELDEAVT